MKSAKKKEESYDDASITHVDKFALDDEWARQADLAKHYGDLLAKAKEKVATLNAAIDVRKAEIRLGARADPEAFDLPKATDESVKDAAIVHPDVQELTAQLIKAKYRVDLLDSAVTALENKKKALENEVFLYGQSYFSKPARMDPVKVAGRRTPRGTDS